MILDLHRQGLSLSAIARHTGLDRKTVAEPAQETLAVQLSGLFACILDRSCRLLPHAMRAGWIAPSGLKPFGHGAHNLG